ncbi:MAG: DUF2336 domain-containing protein [Salinarimonadaceae bacterium]|nr:MAG: DUF2336 domain-containing protein [Salinarimonadaceae bacterium]
MLQEIQHLVQQIERRHGDPGPIEKAVIVERLRGLYESKARRLPDDRAAMFDHLFLNLTEGVDQATKRQLAQTFAKFPKGPKGVVARLVLDEDPEVAAPLLSSALRIEHRLLTTVARQGGQQHLRALAKRPGIGERITTPLARRGDDDTVVALSSNVTATFDTQGFDLLSERARANAMLRSFICARPDIPDGQFAMLLALDGALACDEFDREYRAPSLSGEALLAMISAAMRDTAPSPFAGPIMRASFDYVATRANRRSIRRDDIVRWLNRNQNEDAIAGLAFLSAMPPDLVERLFASDSLFPSAMLIKAIGFDWATLKPFWQARIDLSVPQEETLEVYKVFGTISVTTARRFMRHVALRNKVIAFPEAPPRSL